jgi:hypothetical protein
MWAYRIASGNNVDWKIDEWRIHRPHNPDETGLIYQSAVLLHTKRFSAEEFKEMCDNCIKQWIPFLVTSMLKELGDSIIGGHSIESAPLNKDRVAGIVYFGLIREYGFQELNTTEEFIMPRNTEIPFNAEETSPPKETVGIILRLRHWCNKEMIKRKKEALEK